MLLSNSTNEKIYVEFEVTHASSEKKIKSGQKIIEISIDCEEDLEPILQRKLSTTDINIKMMNFQFHDKVVNCWNTCKTSKSFFTISPDGGARVLTNTPKFMKNQFDKGVFYLVKYMKEVDHYYYVKELQDAYWKKWNIKNCFLCRYHVLNHYRDENSGPIYCKFRKTPFVSTEAVKCEYYRPDPEVFPIKDK